MADNIDVDPGTGASKLPVATDDCGAAGHIQRVKLDIGGDGVSSPFIDPATETTLASALTSLQTIDNAISGTGVNVSQIGGSAARTADLDLGAGTDTYPVTGIAWGSIGGARIASDTDPLPVGGEVTVLTNKVPSDSPFGTDQLYVAGLLRDDALSTLTENDNEFTYGRVDSTGALWSHITSINSALPAGTNNIGDVDVLTQPARAATTDNIGAKLATDAIMNGTTALTPKFAIIDAATSGDNTLVASVSGKKIRVLAAFLVAAGAVNARFESGAGGTALTGQMNLTTNSGFTLPFNPVGWFETAATTLLNLELSGAVSVDGCLTYVEV